MRGQGGNNGQGHHWCWPATRLAIYLRDGFACVWCALGPESGAQLTLDHYVPRSSGGSNEPTNLITACLSCNSARRHKPATVFAKELYENRSREILLRIGGMRRRTLPRAEAREMLGWRGTVSKVIAARLRPAGIPRELFRESQTGLTSYELAEAATCV